MPNVKPLPTPAEVVAAFRASWAKPTRARFTRDKFGRTTGGPVFTPFYAEAEPDACYQLHRLAAWAAEQYGPAAAASFQLGWSGGIGTINNEAFALGRRAAMAVEAQLGALHD